MTFKGNVMGQNLKYGAELVLAFTVGSLGLIAAGMIAHYFPWQDIGEALIAIART